MDRNQIIGIVMIFLILLGYSVFMAPSAEEQAKIKQKQDSLKTVEIEQFRADSLQKVTADSIVKLEKERILKISENDSLNSDSAVAVRLKNKYGIFGDAVKGEEKFITLKNNKVEIKITTLGAFPYSVNLKEFKTFEKDSLFLFADGENEFSINFFADKKAISTKDFIFENVEGQEIYDATSSKQTVTFRLKAGNDKYIEYVYSLEPDSYLVNFDINFVGLNKNIQENTSYLNIAWNSKSRKQEKSAKNEDRYTTIYLQHNEGDIDYLSESSKTDSKNINTRVKWIAFKDHFFSSVLIADKYFSSADLKHEKDPNQTKYIKYFESNIAVPYEGKASENIKLHYYFGPNDFEILSEVSVNADDDLEMERMVPLGWGIFRWTNKYFIIPLFNFLGSFIHSYGLIILVLTVIIKLILFPLTYKSYLSSAKMRVLKPQIDEITAKFKKKEDSMKKQQATMALYKKVGVNPMGGCLPMVIQMPILFAMFRFFPASIELRQESFLWAKDLSSYDSIYDLGFNIPFYGDHVSLFTLLMAVALAGTTLLNQNQMSGQSSMPGMKGMMWMMPVMMLFFFNNYSSGLTYYYFLANMITIGQTLIIRRSVDETKILAKLNANKKKVVKKSKMQMKLDEMQKKQALAKNNKKKK